MSRGLVSAFMALFVIAVLASCGGGDDTTASGPRLTKAQLIKQGDKICREANQRRLAGLNDLIEETKSGEAKERSREEEEELVRELVLPSFQEEAEELAELNPPQGDEEQFEALIEAIEEGVEKAEENPGVVLTQGAETVFGKAQRIGGEYGFEACGRS